LTLRICRFPASHYGRSSPIDNKLRLRYSAAHNSVKDKSMERKRVWIRIESLPRGWVEELRRKESRAEIRQGKDDEVNPDWLAKVEVVFTDLKLPDVLVRRLTNLKWVQFTRGTAYELIDPALRDSGVGVSVVPTVDGVQFAEFAMGCILLLAKQFPHFFHAQLESRWERATPLEIAGMTLGILGLGTIGSAIARKAKAFDMRVLGMKRVSMPKPEFVDELWTPEHLRELLARCDFLVITLPSTPALFGLIGLEELRLMKKTAYLINLTGGKAIKEEHLVRALKENWIAGAVLDALPRQPLPPDSELWDLSNVIITPRIAGYTPKRWQRLIPVFQKNLKNFLSGEPIPLINKELGY
jgi:phosphoglycerate dehydrogenase-like enzyme